MFTRLNMSSFDYNDAKQKDLEDWQEWKKTGSKKALNKLMTRLDPVTYSEVHRASGTLPTTALALEARNWTYKAIQSYDPTKGTALATHVQNYLPKVRRMNYKYQNAVRLPENMQLKYHEYNRQLAQLTEELNREPTDPELAHRLGWTKPQVVKFKNSLFADHIESASERPAEFTQFNDRAILMEHILGQLSPEERFILDNHGTMSATEVSSKLGVNINRYNYLKKKLTDKIAAMKHDSGM